MKRTIGVLGILLIFAYVGFVLGAEENSDIMKISVNVFAPEPDVIGIEVPDSLDFGNVTKGEESEIFDVYINNTGNVGITVRPELSNNSEEVFGYLFFRRVQSDPFTQIGDFSVNISKPVEGGIRSQRTYAMLDLTDYDGNLGNDEFVKYETNVIFWAVAQ